MTTAPVYEEIMKKAKEPNGIEASRYVYKLHGKKKLFTAQFKMGNVKKRYFDTQERADEFYKDRKPSKKTHPKAKKLLQSSEYPVVFIAHRNTPGGPARAPGEPVITPQTKFTYGRKPEQTLKSNTHSLWG